LAPFDLAGEVLDADGLDANLVENFHGDLGIQNKSRDGLASDLFPLTSSEQRKYHFTLEGEENYRGRNVYRLRFEPLRDGGPHDEGIWKGEVLVDRTEFQPVSVVSQFALKIPRWVRMIFGINVRQVGFSVTYERFGKNVWFPVSYGGEFFIKLFHLYKRTAVVSVVSKDFRHASADSKIAYEDSSDSSEP
jgi:hypothetical protein